MRKFTDAEGREWVLRLSVANLIKVTEELGVSLQDLVGMKIQLSQLLKCLPILCAKQIKECGISEEDFLESIELPHLRQAFESLMDEVKESFPEAKGGLGDGGPFDPGESKTSSSLPQPQESTLSEA